MPTPDHNPLEPSFVTATLELPASVALSTLIVHHDSGYSTFDDGNTAQHTALSNYSTEYGPVPTSLSSGGCPDVSVQSATVTVTDTQTETAQKTVYISAITCEMPKECPTVYSCLTTAPSNATSSQTEPTPPAAPTAAGEDSASVRVTPSSVKIAIITSFLALILIQNLCA